MITETQRRLVLVLIRLRAFRMDRGFFGQYEIQARAGFRWVLEWLKRNQAVDELWHAPACPANHYHKRRLIFQPCSCGPTRLADSADGNE